MDARLADLVAAFKTAFGQPPSQAVRAPGRVNLIGEHTDYNDGFCLPLAIDYDVRVALRPRRDRTVRVTSLQQPGAPVEFQLGKDIAKAIAPGERWADYVKGCAQALAIAGIRLV